MNLIIIGKRGCPFSIASMKTARILHKQGVLRRVTSLYTDTKSGLALLSRMRKHVPRTHKTYPMIFVKRRKQGPYQFVGGNAEFQQWVRKQQTV